MKSQFPTVLVSIEPSTGIMNRYECWENPHEVVLTHAATSGVHTHFTPENVERMRCMPPSRLHITPYVPPDPPKRAA